MPQVFQAFNAAELEQVRGMGTLSPCLGTRPETITESLDRLNTIVARLFATLDLRGSRGDRHTRAEGVGLGRGGR